ncbi:hypothetical protein [Catenulispora rubra]|uniref:hypothetical protein n=1 Tax=Catenulispora rubra TaxID=280293 RepID=UPI001891FEE2|nr:hypothetical protein [Catenulispora rubra]
MSSVDFLADLGSSAEARAVARVLSAAAAPPWPHELRGYESARRAFENAGAAPVRGGTHGAGVRTGAAKTGVATAGAPRAGVGVPLRRLIGVKLAAVAGALTVTGVAVAAEADVLPSPIQRAAHQMLGGVGVPDPDAGPRGEQTMASSPGSSGVPGSQGAPGSLGSPGSQGAQGSQGSHPGQLLTPNSQGTDQASDSDSSSAGSLPGTPVGTADTSAQSAASTPPADALALCRTYVAHQGNGDANGNGKDKGGLNEHDRRRLAAMAGGEDKIGAFCAQVLAAASGTPVPQPTGASTPTTSPTSTPTSPSTSPDPSHDHKPAADTSSSAPGFGPVSTSSQDGGGGKHRRASRKPYAGT